MAILLKDNIRTNKDRLRQARMRRFRQWLYVAVAVGLAVVATQYYFPQK